MAKFDLEWAGGTSATTYPRGRPKDLRHRKYKMGRSAATTTTTTTLTLGRRRKFGGTKLTLMLLTLMLVLTIRGFPPLTLPPKLTQLK